MPTPSSTNTDTTTHYISGIALVLCASALSSFGWIFEGEAVARLQPLAVTCVSLLAGGLVLLATGRMRGALRSEGVRVVATRGFLLFSLVRSAFLTFLFCYCLTLTSSTKTMFLTKIEPYLVLLIQIIWFNHRTSLGHLALLAVHIAGAVLLSTGGVLELSLTTLGDLLLFLAVAGNAALYAPTQRYTQQLGALYAAGFSQLIGGLLLLPFMLIFARESFTPTAEHATGWYYAFLTVLFFHVLSTGMWFAAMRHVPAWLASALRSFGPVFAAPVAWIWFNQPLSLIQTAGACLVVITSAWMVVLERRAKG